MSDTAIQPAETAKRSSLAVVNGALRPKTPADLWQLATIMFGAGMLPKGIDTKEKVCLAIMFGMEIGLTPTQAVQSVMVVNNRPTIWGDAALGLVRASGLLVDIEETYTDKAAESVATCRIQRKGQATPIVRMFSWRDAVRAGLAGKDLYKLYPQRMLPARARAFALRDGFADILKGISIREEVEDYQPTGEAVLAASDAPALPALEAAGDDIDKLVEQPPTPAPNEPAPMTEAEQTAIKAKEAAEAKGGFDSSGNPI